ncbi:dCTP deaminase [Pollutimonas sp. H1-120]|uniref:dCTP deaminase n=1 Tax=Pollutimonas sp. H1-120 TaxID=3148824 RepID=UPI003B52B586
MKLLTRDEILQSLSNDDPNTLFLDPLLTMDQVGSVTVDLRLGYDFLVSILTRKPAIEPRPYDHERKRGIDSYFQETRRRTGERFILYPHQVVLSTTLEFLSLPTDVFAEVSIRSSYGRLGVGVSTSMQPGWRGTVPLELFNHGNTPVEMVVGSRVCQIHLYQIGGEVDYVDGGAARKYFGTVRPGVSRADKDEELGVLARLAEQN